MSEYSMDNPAAASAAPAASLPPQPQPSFSTQDAVPLVEKVKPSELLNRQHELLSAAAAAAAAASGGEITTSAAAAAPSFLS